jgi:hypothetical protein
LLGLICGGPSPTAAALASGCDLHGGVTCTGEIVDVDEYEYVHEYKHEEEDVHAHAHVYAAVFVLCCS